MYASVILLTIAITKIWSKYDKLFLGVFVISIKNMRIYTTGYNIYIIVLNYTLYIHYWSKV